MGNNEQDSVTTTMSELGTGTSPVEFLELRQSKLHHEDLDRVLRACKNLNTLIYEVGHSWAWYPMRAQEIRRSIEPLEATLENLVLDQPYYMGKTGDGEYSPVSFAKFGKLRYLKTSTMHLSGTTELKGFNLMEVFPAGLVELHVTYVG